MNLDGVADQVVVTAGISETTPVVGQVQIQSGANASVLATLSTAQPNDYFGFAWSLLSDVTGDGHSDIAVAAPRSQLVSGPVGKLYIYSGVTGTLVRELVGPTDARIGLSLLPVPDQDDDGVEDIVVGGMRLTEQSEWIPAAFVYSAATGRLLTSVDRSASEVAGYAQGGGLLYLASDVDHSGAANQQDVVSILMWLNTTVTPWAPGDVNGDGEIDAIDASRAFADYLDGRYTIQATAAVFVDPAVWFAWNDAFPENAIKAPSGEELTGGCDCSSPVGGGSGSGNTGGGTPCALAPSISCPGIARVGDEIVVSASGGEGSCSWSIGGTAEASIVSSDQGSIHLVATMPGTLVVRISCSESDCCSCAECTIQVGPPVEGECGVIVEIVNSIEMLAANRSYSFVAVGHPAGLEFRWSHDSSPDGPIVASYTTTTFEPDDTFIIITNSVGGEASVYVRYGVPSCYDYDECRFRSIGDADNDGANDSEDDPDPTNPDTDGDGWLDGCELRIGTSPINDSSYPIDDGDDADGDGLSDIEELCTGSNPYWPGFDTDNDGVQDLAERELGLHPTIVDSDSDGQRDGNEALYTTLDRDGDGVYDEFEDEIGLDSSVADIDGDGMTDGRELELGRDPRTDDHGVVEASEPDSDGDGLTDFYEEAVTHTNPAEWDSDRDGLPDGAEFSFGYNPNHPDTDGDGIPDGAEDLDGDGLLNADEIVYETSMAGGDSDGDGVSDGQEVSQASDPNDPSDGGVAPPSDLLVTFRLYVGGFRPYQQFAMHFGPAAVRTPPGGLWRTRDIRLPGGSYQIRLQQLGSWPRHHDVVAEVEWIQGADCDADLDDPYSILGLSSPRDWNHTATYTFGTLQLSPDPATHVSMNSLAILPGDVETVYVAADANAVGKAKLRADPDFASFIVNGELVQEVDVVSQSQQVFVFGKREGITDIWAVAEWSGYERPCAILPTYIGGRIVLEYDHAPTFKTPEPETPPAPPPAPGNGANRDTSEPLSFRWPGERPAIPADIISQINQLPQARTTFRVTLQDAAGNPKKGKRIAIASRDGSLKAAPGTLVTDARGRVETMIDADSALITDRVLTAGTDPNNLQAIGVVRDNVAVLYGRSAELFESGELPSSHINALRQENAHVATGHASTGHSSKYWGKANATPGNIVDVGMMTIDMVAINHVQFYYLIQHMKGGVYTEPARQLPPDTLFSELNAVPCEDLDCEPGYTSVELGQDETPEHYLNSPEVLSRPTSAVYRVFDGIREDYLENSERFRQVAPTPQPWQELRVAPEEPEDPEDPPPGWEGVLVTAESLITDIAVSMIPFSDVIDIFTAFVWDPWVNGEEVDYITGALGAIGTAMDVFPIGNFAIGAVKAIVKRLPPGVTKVLFHMTDSVVGAIHTVITIISRVPSPPGTTLLVQAVNGGQFFINQAKSIANSSLHLLQNHLGTVLPIFKRRATKSFSHEAAEGACWLAKHERHMLIEGLFDAGWPDEVIDSTLGVLRAAKKADALPLELTDDAIHGVAAAVEAVGVGQQANAVKNLLKDGLANLPVEKLDTAFKQIGELKDVPGLDGLDRLVRDFKGNTGTVEQFNGILYEGRSALLIKNAQIPNAGTLTHVGDRVGREVVDIQTTTMAIQNKFINNRQFIDVGDFDVMEIDDLVIKAGSLTPVLMSNKPATVEYLQLLSQKGVTFIQVD